MSGADKFRISASRLSQPVAGACRNVRPDSGILDLGRADILHNRIEIAHTARSAMLIFY